MIRQPLPLVCLGSYPSEQKVYGAEEAEQDERNQVTQQSPNLPRSNHPIDSPGCGSFDGSGEITSPQSPFGSRERTHYRIRDDEPPRRSIFQRRLEDERSRRPEPSSMHIPRMPPTRLLCPPPRQPLTIERSYRRLREQSPEPSSPSYRSILPNVVSNEAVSEYGRIGAQYQSWISGRSRAECPIQRSSITWHDLVSYPLMQYGFEVCTDEFRLAPEEAGNIQAVGLSTGRSWRFVFLIHRGYVDGGYELGSNVYMHRTGPGAIFAENIARSFGPYWGQIAQAQYQLDHHIDTLRYIYFINVQNPDTSPYVETRLYPRHGLVWYDDNGMQDWEYATREYQELLGTKLGRAVARLILGAWPRGTHRVEKIVTWTLFGVLQMRFDIKPV